MLSPILRRLSLLLLLHLIISGLCAQSDKNILIVGIDGLRGDAFMAAHTPNIDGFMNAGEYSYDCDAGLKTIHGPSWASILTGVWFKKHNIKSDEFKKPLLDPNPHLSSILNNSHRAASLVKWEAINEQIDCCSPIQTSGGTDEIIKNKAIGIIEKDEADLIFMQLGDVNEAGSLSAYGPNSAIYIKAIERMDRQFSAVLKAVQQHAASSQEEWMIFVCTDHGGHENKHQGQQKLTEVRMVPQILAFCRKDGSIGIDMADYYVSLSDASNVNIVPTILNYLSYPVPIYLDGNSYLKPLGESAAY
ncbi:MAG: hypothetical protein GY751_11430 [Bacteroidetes bacterium]|nr:hypothetical protein [Bacteroidota bacterium]